MKSKQVALHTNSGRAANGSMQESRRDSVAVLIFPFPSPGTERIGEKILTVLGSVSSHVLCMGKTDLRNWAKENTNVQYVPLRVRLHYLQEKSPILVSGLSWIAKCFLLQVEMGWKLLVRRKDYETVLCTVGCYYQIPGILVKILKKRLIVCSFGNDFQNALQNYGSAASLAINLLREMMFWISDVIVVESMRLLTDPTLKRHQPKCKLGSLFVEEYYSLQNTLESRAKIVGYIGRISREKGIFQFIEAIPKIRENISSLRFVVIGSGREDTCFRDEINRLGLDKVVEWHPWAARNNILNWLNQFRLIVVPSVSEGLPNIILEAAACGTPVIATGVGGIPDVIADRITGFVLKDNSPDAIAKGILHAYSYPDIKKIADRARAFVAKEFSLSASIRRYDRILAWTDPETKNP